MAYQNNKITILFEESIGYEKKLNKFGEGEWLNEPDLLIFTYKHINCVVARYEFGAFCGYCLIPSDHFFNNYLDYDNEPICDLDVHGGVTFFEEMETSVSSEAMLLAGKWIGFDCAHSMDLSPSSEKEMEKLKENIKKAHPELADLISQESIFPRFYRNIDYVIEECCKLSDQILNYVEVSK